MTSSSFHFPVKSLKPFSPDFARHPSFCVGLVWHRKRTPLNILVGLLSQLPEVDVNIGKRAQSCLHCTRLMVGTDPEAEAEFPHVLSAPSLLE